MSPAWRVIKTLEVQKRTMTIDELATMLNLGKETIYFIVDGMKDKMTRAGEKVSLN